ncbi:MAG: TetR/AcrR family transcriptional regulator [Gammaproteobacteria bacterium]
MMQPAITKDPADIILECAIQRFSIYGFNKTTMAEIADDASMSAANIYRYFKNKQDIAAVCTRNIMNERLAVLTKAIRNPELTAGQRLEQYVLETLQFSRTKANENSKIDEICNEITRHRPDLVHHKIENEKALIMEILTLGNQTGEFQVDNVMKRAEAIHAMLVVFDVPMFMHLFSEEQYLQIARSSVQIILAGLGSGSLSVKTE